MPLLSVPEALARVLDGVEPMAVETVALLDARGRVLAAGLAAKLTQPPFDVSAMDGWAVRAADVAKAGARLRVVGEAAAGRGFLGAIGPGEAVRIFTGAPVPVGADTVVIQENAGRAGDWVTVREGAPEDANTRSRGGDFREGDTLLRAGRVLEARALTLAAAMGQADLPVRRKPRVAILATGDELVPPGTTPGPDQIVSSIPYGLAAMVEAAGGEARLLGIARDTRAELSAKLGEAKTADILVTIGGASVGDHDLVGAALGAEGLELSFWKIAMRPGKPLLFGRLGHQRVLGLPGNPVSALICARLFLVPLIRRLLGVAPEAESAETARLAHGIPANGPRAHYMRATLAEHEGDRRVTVLPSQDSSLLSVLAEADCLVVRPPAAPSIPTDSEVPILSIDF